MYRNCKHILKCLLRDYNENATHIQGPNCLFNVININEFFIRIMFGVHSYERIHLEKEIDKRE